MARRSTVVAAPVRPVLNGPLDAVTSTSARLTTTRVSVRCTSLTVPRERNNPSTVARWYPMKLAVTRYGPPTRIPGMVKRPSALAMAE